MSIGISTVSSPRPVSRQSALLGQYLDSQDLQFPALALYRDRGGRAQWDFKIPRDDPILVAVVEELGEAASTNLSELEVVDIPDGTSWVIEEYDGLEWVAESHQTW